MQSDFKRSGSIPLKRGSLGFLSSLALIAFLFLPLILHAQDSWRLRLGGTSIHAVGINPLNSNTVYAYSGSLLVSYNRGFTWSTLGDPGIGNLNQILVHPSDTSVIFCLAISGGLQRSSDYGGTWTDVLPDLGIDGESLVLDPLHPDTLFAGNFEDGAAYRSTDRGLTWDLRSHAGSYLCALAVRPDSAQILYAGTGNGAISKSTDAGLTWRLVKDEGAFETPRIAVDPIDPMVAYATASGGSDTTTGVWKTTDGGEHWMLTNLRGLSVWAMEVDRNTSGVVYSGLWAEGRGVFKTTDGGIVWDTLAIGLPQIAQAWNLKVHPMNPTMIWLAIGGIYRWLPSIATIQGFILDAATGDTVTNGFIKLASTGEQILLDSSGGSFSFHYYDGDPSLTSIAHLEAYPYYSKDESVEFMIDSVITHDIVLTPLIRTSITGRVEDSISHSPLSAGITLTSTTSVGGMIYTTNTNPDGTFLIDSLYISYPPTNAYDAIVVKPTFPHGQLTVRSVVLDTIQFDLNASLDTADVLITESSGSGNFTGYYADVLDSLRLTYHLWDQLQEGVAPLSRGMELRKDIVIYYTGNDSIPLLQNELDSLNEALQRGVHLFISGQNFVEANESSTFLSLVLGVVHAGNTAATTSRGTRGDLFSDLLVFTSGGSGANNQTSRDVIQIVDSFTVPIFGYGLLGDLGTAGVRLDSAGSGARVVLLGFGFEAINFRQARELVMQTIVGYFDGSIVLGVDNHTGEPRPLSYRLEQNYPNPFNPVTQIRFAVPKRVHVKLEVYDVVGVRVEILLDEVKDAGNYGVTFHGRHLSSGIYFYRMQAGNFEETKKLVLIK